MNCSDARQFLYSYADGELADDANPAAAGHFRTCRDCGRLVQVQRGLRATLRRGVEHEPVPDGLEDRIRRSITARRPDARARRMLGLFGAKPLAIAAVLVIGVAVTWRVAFSGEPANPVAVAIATKHKYCNDRASVHHHDGLLTTLVGLVGAMNAHEDYRFATIAPDLTPYGFYFESANFCGLRNRECRNGGHVVYVHKDGGKINRFSVFSVPKADPLTNLEMLVNSGGVFRPVKAPPDEGGPEVCIVVWHKDDTHYICCGEVDPDQLVKMASSVHAALANPQTEAMFVSLARGR
jgi:hypothetical protein